MKGIQIKGTTNKAKIGERKHNATNPAINRPDNSPIIQDSNAVSLYSSSACFLNSFIYFFFLLFILLIDLTKLSNDLAFNLPIGRDSTALISWANFPLETI